MSGLDAKVVERAMKVMDSKQKSLAQRAYEGFMRTGNKEYLAELIRLVEAVDPCAAREIGARVRK